MLPHSFLRVGKIFLCSLFNKIDSRREAKLTSSAWKLTSSAFKWYYSLSREIFLYLSIWIDSISFGNFWVATLFQKLWSLLYKRAKLDLRSTKYLENRLFRLRCFVQTITVLVLLLHIPDHIWPYNNNKEVSLT